MAANVRLKDIASELGLSETTVSRALSGKGRVSEATRILVEEHIRKTGYRPNMLARGLAQSRSYNICAVLPPDAVSGHQSFFHGCLMGICSCAESCGYNVLVTTVPEDSRARIERILSGGSADGYILMRGTADDPLVDMLVDREVPFVLVGTSDTPGVCCVDADNEENCFRLSMKVFGDGFVRPGLLVGDMRHLVNRSRKAGFNRAAESFGVKVCPQIRTDIVSEKDLDSALELFMKLDCDVFFCGDDILAARTLRLLGKSDRHIPVVSFYGSELLELCGNIYACVEEDARELGVRAAGTLLDMISKEDI